MWKNIPECRSRKDCPLMAERKEHRIYLIFDYHEGGDVLPCENARYMTLATAQEILQKEAGKAAELGKSELLAVLKGGDPFQRFDELKELCAWARETAWPGGTAARFEVTAWLKERSEEEIRWYMKNRDRIDLWIRCRGLTEEEVSFALDSGCGIHYIGDLEDGSRIVNDIRQLIDRDLPFRIDSSLAESIVEEEDHKKYRDLLKKLQELPGAYALPWAGHMMDRLYVELGVKGDLLSGGCYDTSGWKWPCPALSPLHLHSWSLEEEILDEVAEKNVRAAFFGICPGEMLKWGKRWKELRRIRIEEENCAVNGLVQQESHVIIKMLDEIWQQIQGE